MHECPNCKQDGIDIGDGDWTGTRLLKCKRCKCTVEATYTFVGYAPGHEEASGYNLTIKMSDKRLRKKRSKNLPG